MGAAKCLRLVASDTILLQFAAELCRFWYYIIHHAMRNAAVFPIQFCATAEL